MTIRRKLAALMAGLLLMATPALVLAVDDPSEMLPNPQQEPALRPLVHNCAAWCARTNQ